MAKKIRFPLEMNDGIEARTMDELREHFAISPVLAYLENGKLLTWLRDRYEDDLADALENLDLRDTELAANVCKIFEVEVDLSAAEDMEAIQERNRKIELLKEAAADEKFFDLVDQVAFTQDELYDLLDDGQTTIYLCGEEFSIPLGKKGITYIGINQPIAQIASKAVVDWEEKGIRLTDVRFDGIYQALLKEKKELGALAFEELICTEGKIIIKYASGEEVQIPTECEKYLINNDQYAVFGRTDCINSIDWLEVVDLKSRTVIYSGNPKGEYGNYNGLKLCGDWIVWHKESFNVKTEEQEVLLYSDVTSFTVANDKIIYVSFQTKNRPSSYDFYICDIRWGNAKKIMECPAGGDVFGVGGLYIYSDPLKYEDGKIRFRCGFKRSVAFGDISSFEYSFDLKDAIAQSKNGARTVYIEEDEE